jgi:topoisomerase-4 subunit B
MPENQYNEDSIRSLDWKEHIRLRPGMYIGKLGNGSSAEDGIYILMKEVIDNSIDEFMMGNGKRIDIKLNENKVSVRDYGRGIPLGKVVDVVSKINTGAKYDSKVFQKSVGLNGVGTKAVNALSSYFMVKSIREGKSKEAIFERGILVNEIEDKSDEKNGTYVEYIADTEIFKNHKYISDYIDNQMWNYVYLNAGLTVNFNGNKYFSKNGLLDLLERKTNLEEIKYPIIHLKEGDIEMAITHDNHYGEDYYSFV